ncbi:PaaI family thioesterase [Paenibacillus melissococcoides]|uniref:PaaI family thioesterase n=1 Tax=Paenibacillus melissococcoides TaxID=2912268 RepID=A0ABN8U2V7_9BACL|nr:MULTISPECIES: PaaI family thioesterase [Paenibacillus]MEB9898145.1 PaaI family thioesterase [Bacillus cereus]CAH8243865.1 PaaI family thioesterase [Paenibacillus melissococcoides]CAH8704367.1 PaaI family thioesterase [Paenibacillus melissococcoides]CAH8707137.1 PaaI family thioesterase [Paenibacillus melissococcoides]GIO77359.1 thioesterase [Paenibacillus dendritiformis]
MSGTGGDAMQRWAKLEELAATSFWGYLGCELVRVGERETIVRLQARERHLNMTGTVHGGVLASLLDSTMGIAAAANRPDDQVVTTNLNVHYVHPLRAGLLEVRAHVVHSTNRMMTVYGSVTGEDGRLGTIGTGSFRVKG